MRTWYRVHSGQNQAILTQDIVFYRIMCCIVKYDNLGKSRLSEESDFVNKDEIVGIVVFISSIIVRSIFKRFSYRD